jgi:Raf kinase inhibitor-like YbhB/YbcL family protein
MVQRNAFALLAACVFAGSTWAAESATSAAMPTFQASSPDVVSGKPIAARFIYNGFGCTGQNVSPAVMWKNAPAGTKSFAVMVHDPDAPTGGAGFWHWIVVNLPASTTFLAQGSGTADGKGLPAGSRQINTDFGAPGWGGPCPPAGDKPHRYNFTVYALKVDKLDLPPTATASLTGFMVNSNVLGKATFTGTFGR